MIRNPFCCSLRLLPLTLSRFARPSLLACPSLLASHRSNEMGTMSGDYDLGLEDEDEDDDFGAEEEKKSGDGKSSSDNQLFNFALARMSSLISSSDPLLPSHSCSLMSKYALLLSSAWGVAVAEKTGEGSTTQC